MYQILTKNPEICDQLVIIFRQVKTSRQGVFRPFFCHKKSMHINAFLDWQDAQRRAEWETVLAYAQF